ncbi:DUF262 domain-containing protein [uncultured Luteimonas sp.]|uniref:DUF262 domain-containing protein n=1 Tax=uncultured Luteimonas sp. TaxID=453144 RepID=UPI002630A6C0|nr:DUF262 domain-containing protein [uncultured Luteimonas sp.]
MKDAQKPDHIGLNALVTRLKEGRFVIPDFQREFEWKPWDIGDLMRSIFLDYYIGSLLLWKGKKENFDALSCEHVYGYGGGDSNREHIVLDGQQRLTAMHYAFIAPDEKLPGRKKRYLYFIRVDRFMEAGDEDAFVYDWTKYGPKLLANPQAQYEQHMFPLAIVGKGGWALPDWFREYEAYWLARRDAAKADGDDEAADKASRHVEDAKGFGAQVKDVTEQYQIAYIELDRDLEVEKVCDIFTQINSRGVKLDIFDLMNALLKPKGLQLKSLWRKAKPRLSFVESDKLNVYILQVMSILRQTYCSPKYLYYLLPGQAKPIRDASGRITQEVLIADEAEFSTRWKAAVDAMETSIAMLRHPHEFGVTSSQYLPYVSILPAFSALQAHVTNLPAVRRLDAQRKVRDWYWASVFTSRYSGSVESTAARDFQDLRRWIDDDGDEPALIAEFKHHFRNLELRKETRRGSSIYNGIFNLLVLQGARDWMKGTVPVAGDLDDHHIVPRAWVKKHVGSLGDSILNRTPLSAETNRHVISDRLPNEYLPELIANNGEQQVRDILASHFVSDRAFDILLRNPFTPEDFEAFIAERQRTIQEAIETLLVKRRLDLPVALRELDEGIEQVELRLRETIRIGLSDDPALVPANVADKVDERLQRALKRNAAMDADHYAKLEGQLEYFDLRELQDTLVNKPLWPRFEARFGTKEVLNTRFGQFAELRNAIRHSRSVDAVVRKDGEAALLWFQQVLA